MLDFELLGMSFGFCTGGGEGESYYYKCSRRLRVLKGVSLN